MTSQNLQDSSPKTRRWVLSSAVMPSDVVPHFIQEALDQGFQTEAVLFMGATTASQIQGAILAPSGANEPVILHKVLVSKIAPVDCPPEFKKVEKKGEGSGEN